MYQCFWTIICTINFASTSLWIINLALLTLRQVYSWYDDHTGRWENFSDIESICQNGKIKDTWHLDYENERTIINLITELDLQCQPSWKTSLFGSFYLIGFIMSTIILMFSAKYGRKINIVIGAYLDIACHLVLIFIPNLYVKYVFFFLLGITLFKNTQAFILLTECVCSKHKMYVTSIVLSTNGIILIFTAVYFKFIDKDWKFLYYIFGAIAILAALATHLLPESPKFLHENNKYTQARQVINLMARINWSSTLTQNDWIFDKEDQESDWDSDKIVILPTQDEGIENGLNRNINDSESNNEISTNPEPLKKNISIVKQNQPSLKSMVKDPRVLINLLIVMLLWTSTLFNNYLLNFSIKSIGGNVYYNAWAYGTAAITGKFIVSFFRDYFSTVSCVIMMLLISIVGGFLVIFIESSEYKALSVWMVQLGLGGGVSLVYFITTEYFAVLFVSYAFALSQASSRSFSIFSFIVSDLHEPIPMIILESISIASIISILWLKKPKTS